MNQMLFETVFLFTLSLGFFLVYPQDSLRLSLPLLMGLLIAFAFQKFFKRGSPHLPENELDNRALEPSFWVAFGVKVSEIRNSNDENQFLSFVAEKKLFMRIAAVFVFFLTLLTNTALGNAPRTWSFWLNLLMIVFFSKAITTHHYWLCLFFNVLATLTFFVTAEQASYFGLSIYLFLICLLFVLAKLKFTMEAYASSRSYPKAPLLKGLQDCFFYSLLIFVLGFCFNWLLPSKKPSLLREKAHSINVQWAKWLPQNSHATPIKNWSNAVQASKEISDAEWRVSLAKIKRLKRTLSTRNGGGFGKSQLSNSSAMRALEKLEQGEEPTDDELNSLNQEIARFREHLNNSRNLTSEQRQEFAKLLGDEVKDPESKDLSKSDKALFEEAEKMLRSGSVDNNVESAAGTFAKKLDPTLTTFTTPLVTPKKLNLGFSLISKMIISAFFFIAMKIIWQFLRKVDPRKEKAEQEEQNRREAFNHCLDELAALRKKKMSPREEIIAFYRLFLKMMSCTPKARPDFLPSESYSENLERDLPKINESLRITNTLFSRTLYSILPISDSDLLFFRRHIQVLFDLATEV
ncbi:MAG: hypothetical protein ACKN9V_06850 [Pseudomonadota bacterium]